MRRILVLAVAVLTLTACGPNDLENDQVPSPEPGDNVDLGE